MKLIFFKKYKLNNYIKTIYDSKITKLEAMKILLKNNFQNENCIYFVTQHQIGIYVKM